MATSPAVPEPPADISEEIAALFEQLPHLEILEYGVEWTVNSRSTDDYNCLAWAMADCEQPWSPALQGGYYWPPDLVLGVPVLDVVAELFRREGYAECGDPEAVAGTEKVALYADPLREVRHAARRRGNGWWMSKMGDLADIEHVDVAAVECELYGRATMILCRPLEWRAGPEVPSSRLILPS